MLLQRSGVSAPLWTQLIAVVGVLLCAAGGAIALERPIMLVGPDGAVSAAAHIFAGYFAARSLALAGVLLFLVILRANRALGEVLALTGLIQLIDAVIDCAEGRWPIVPGVVILGVVFLLAASRLCGYAFWRRAAWAD